jgi:glutathione S-transferase
MYELYIANKNYSSWSFRPWVLMHELNIPFQERLVQYIKESNWENFRKFSPSGRVPTLYDGHTVIWDSLAITEYLAERHEGVWPDDNAARTWARCAVAEMHSGFSVLRKRCSNSCGVRVELREMPGELLHEIRRLNELWNEGLDRFGGPFLAGAKFTAVDAFYAPVLFRFQTYGLKAEGAAAAYMARVLALPSVRNWYDDGLKETWREESHDVAVASYGTVIEDLRAVNG